jgi:hypothetical protein
MSLLCGYRGKRGLGGERRPKDRVTSGITLLNRKNFVAHVITSIPSSNFASLQNIK